MKSVYKLLKYIKSKKSVSMNEIADKFFDGNVSIAKKYLYELEHNNQVIIKDESFYFSDNDGVMHTTSRELTVSISPYGADFINERIKVDIKFLASILISILSLAISFISLWISLS